MSVPFGHAIVPPAIVMDYRKKKQGESVMRSVHVKIIAEADGELRLANVHVHKGDPVEAILLVPHRKT
jgi:hypothetical protein